MRTKACTTKKVRWSDQHIDAGDRVVSMSRRLSVFLDVRTGDKVYAEEYNNIRVARLFQDRELDAKCSEIVY
jgi:hypothetical protein